MRIVAGERKGARLDTPPGRDTRPTSDRLRESLFSILGDVAGLRVLRANVERLGYGERVELRRQDGRRRIAADAGRGAAYELLLLDPPYRMLPALQAPFSLHLPQLLVPGGLAVIEGPAGSEPLELPLQLDTTRVQGAARLSVYRNG